MKTRHQTSAYGLGQKNNLHRVLICAGLLVLGMSLCNKAREEVRYTLKDLGTLGGNTSAGNSLIASGQVTGNLITEDNTVTEGNLHITLTSSYEVLNRLQTLIGD
jgi:hypothetical protein